MLVPFILFFLLLGWSLYDGDISPKEAAAYVTVWAAFLLLIFLFKSQSILVVVPTVILDIILIVKVFGGDIQIR